MKMKEIRIRPANWTLDLIICNDQAKLDTFLDERYSVQKLVSSLNVTTNLRLRSTGEMRIVIALEKMDYYILVHELVHAMWMIGKHVGYEMNYDTQEWQAVLFEYLYKECVRIDEYKTVK